LANLYVYMPSRRGSTLPLSATPTPCISIATFYYPHKKL